jgi:hypothetical protein
MRHGEMEILKWEERGTSEEAKRGQGRGAFDILLHSTDTPTTHVRRISRRSEGRSVEKWMSHLVPTLQRAAADMLQDMPTSSWKLEGDN